MSIVAVIPAHNEAALISRTVSTLLPQVDKVIVACDNCTDDTRARAEAAGALAFDTVDNTGRKAGALNQALLLIDTAPGNFVLVCDADTIISTTFIADAMAEFADPKVGGVGGVFHADREDGYLRYCQALEWTRYAEKVHRTGKVFVLTGTAAILRTEALESVRSHYGSYYSEKSIVEDFTITVNLKERGWELRSPITCAAQTETMPTWRLLFLQRRRWYLGAIQEVTGRAPTRVMWPYIGQQIMLTLSVLAMTLYLAFTAYLIVSGNLGLQYFWLGIGGLFAFERVYTIWPKGWRARFFAVLVFPELIYSIWLQISYIAAFVQTLTVSDGTWDHVHVTEKEAV